MRVRVLRENPMVTRNGASTHVKVSVTGLALS